MEQFNFAYLVLAAVIWTIGYFHTGKFVRPKWKIPGKLVFYLLVSGFLIYFFNHYSLFFIIGHPMIGLIFHIRICQKHEIKWWNCEPTDKYLELQEKWAKGDFS